MKKNSIAHLKRCKVPRRSVNQRQNPFEKPKQAKDVIGSPPIDVELRGYLGRSPHAKSQVKEFDPFEEVRKGNSAHPWIYKNDDYVLNNSMFSKQFSRDHVTYHYSQPLTHTGRVMKDMYLQFKEPYSWHRRLVWFELLNPRLLESSHVEPSSTLIGNVVVWGRATVQSNCVLRADQNQIMIKPLATVEDNVSITTTGFKNKGRKSKVIVDDQANIRAGAKLFACEVGRRATVGENAIIMEGAVVDEDATVLPNSIVPPDTIIPPGEVWGGNPATFQRKKTNREKEEAVTRANANYEKARLRDYQLMGQYANPVGMVSQQEEVWESIEQANPMTPEEADDRPIYWNTWDRLEHEGTFSGYKYTWPYRYWYDKVRNQLRGRQVPTLPEIEIENNSPFYDNKHLTKSEQEKRRIKRPDLDHKGW